MQINWAKDIRFWIILFFIIRLFNITQPPIEIAHSWRQITGIMVARNFYEVEANILYPQLDFGGEKTGITGTEFPLMNYMHYSIAKVFGFQDWYGRLINLIVASFGIWFFYRLIRRFFNEEHALYASIILLCSLWFVYSRKSMPDIFSTSLSIISLFYAFRYLYDKGRNWDLLLYFLFGCLGILSKIPSVYLFSLLLIPMANKSIAMKSKLIFGGVSVMMLLPSGWWYFSWVPYLNETYGLHHYFMGNPFLQGMQEILQNLADTFKKFYADAMGYIGFALFMVVFIYGILKKSKVILIFLIPSFFFLIFMFKAGFNFPHHSYYILPFVPVMAFVLGWGISQIENKKIVIGILALIAVENIGNQQHDFFTKQSEVYRLGLEEILDTYSSKDDLVAINGSGNPQEIYFTHRKGWIYTEEEVHQKEYVERLKKNNCKLIILNKNTGSLFLELPQVYSDDNYLIYTLE